MQDISDKKLQDMLNSQDPIQRDLAKRELKYRQGANMASKGEQQMLKDMGYTTLGGQRNRYGIETPLYTMIRDEEGNLQERFQEQLADPLQQLKDKYSTTGPTAWAQMQQQKIQDQYAQQADAARAQGATAQAQALENLAMRGGAGGGAAERMAMQGQMGTMGQLQQLGRARAQQGLDLSIADEEMKNKMLMGLGQTEQGIMGRNIGRLQSDIQGQNLFLSNKYKDEMSAYGAEQQAKAQRRASSDGTIICTALYVRGEIDKETFRLTNLHGGWLVNNYPEKYKAYLYTATPIVNLMDRNKLFAKLACKFFKPWVKYVAGEKNFIGKLIYKVGLKLSEINYKLRKEKECLV